MRALEELRAALREARPHVLGRIAADIAAPLFRNEYRGEPWRSGDGWNEALAVPAGTLPPFLVHVHARTFTRADADALLASMEEPGVAQVALVVLGDPPLEPGVRAFLGIAVPWLLDTEGLANLMLASGIGVRLRTIETHDVAPDYFR